MLSEEPPEFTEPLCGEAVPEEAEDVGTQLPQRRARSAAPRLPAASLVDVTVRC